ncbi:MAG: hypothetical protein MOGMAGMI_00778 [Candidatus Omnitrophica bacterium]|nr:hypothetical protein [Candidatus Omnitrophota bacterium]
MCKLVRIVLSLGLSTAFSAATHLCSFKSVADTGMPSCHASASRSSSDCCAAPLPGPGQSKDADNKCCLAPADQPGAVRAIRTDLDQAALDGPVPQTRTHAALRGSSSDRLTREVRPPFFVTYVLNHTYSLHAPPAVL